MPRRLLQDVMHKMCNMRFVFIMYVRAAAPEFGIKPLAAYYRVSSIYKTNIVVTPSSSHHIIPEVGMLGSSSSSNACSSNNTRTHMCVLGVYATYHAKRQKQNLWNGVNKF